MDLLPYGPVPVIPASLVLALAAVARRLLGLRFGIVRTLLAGIIAFVLSGPLFSAMHGASNPDTGSAGQFGLFVLAITLALLAAMVFLVLAEVLVPAGSVPPPYEWWRLVKARAARTRRYGQIVRIAMRHGLGRALRGRWRAGADPARPRYLLTEPGVGYRLVNPVLSSS